MTTNDRFERAMSDWLHEDAGRRVAEHLDEVLQVTARTPQRPVWSSLERWLPMDTTFRPRFFRTPRLSQIVLVGGLILAVLAGLLLYAGSTQHRLPPPFGLARTGEFLSWDAGDIVARAPDGGTPRTLISGPSMDFAPIITRDGTHFAFFRAQSDHESLVMLAGIDGSDVHQVLSKPLSDADWWEWSAGSDRLAIVNTVQGQRTLTVVDVAAGTSQDLSLPGLDIDNDAYWLPPDGSLLIFTAKPHGTTGDAPVAIYTVRPDGTDLTKIVPQKTGPWYNGLDVAPDGRLLSFWNYEPDDSVDGMGSHIHFLDPAVGTDQRQTFDLSAEGETDLRFSPDGQHVVLQREGQNTAQLMITTRDGRGPGLLVGPTFGVQEEANYGFTPDGKTVFLLFASSKPYFFDVASGTQTRGPDRIADFAGYQRLAP
jgi:hypothetical protein